MKTKLTQFIVWMLILLMAASAAGCASAPQAGFNADAQAGQAAGQDAEQVGDNAFQAPTSEPPAPSAPAELVGRFYSEYLGKAEAAISKPLADEQVLESPALTRRMVEETRALAMYYQGMPPQNLYDLFLMAGEAPQEITVDLGKEDGSTATVLVHEKFEAGNVQVLTVLVVKNEAGWQIDDVQAGDLSTPEGTTQAFFNEYIQRVNAFAVQGLEGGFDPAQFMSFDYRSQVAEIKAGFEGSGFDPVLHAQMAPPALAVVEAVDVNGSSARVSLDFAGWDRQVSLEQIDGKWLIVPDLVEGGAKSAAETVEAFYSSYLAARAENAGSRILDSGEISAMLRGELEGFDWENKGTDPFLCTADVPAEVKVTASFYNQARPIVVVESNLPGQTAVLDLVREDFNRWTLRKVTCGGTPEGTAKAFYAWYAGYVSGEEMRNPLVDGAYQDSPWLSEAFKAEIAAELASGEAVADRFLFAQDVPAALSSVRCAEENCALVNLQYGYAAIKQARVEMEGENGALKIRSVHLVDAAESAEPKTAVEGVEFWAPLSDGQYGYALRYPGRWGAAGLNVTDLHTPEEYPVMRTLIFTPDGESKHQKPILLDVMISAEPPVGVNYTGEVTGAIEADGVEGQIVRSEYGQVYVVFQSPARSDQWLIFTCSTDTFNEELPAVLQAMISTLVFRE